MYRLIDLGGAPAEANCAQLGRTADFDGVNRLEVRLYQAAMQARFGPPPEGCDYVRYRHVHDFGVYNTLGLRVADAAGEAARAYAAEAENGLASWLEAGFAPPIRYLANGSATTGGRSFDDVVRGAMMTTRPAPGGRFPIPDFAVLHANLKAVFPDIALTLELPGETG